MKCEACEHLKIKNLKLESQIEEYETEIEQLKAEKEYLKDVNNRNCEQSYENFLEIKKETAKLILENHKINKELADQCKGCLKHEENEKWQPIIQRLVRQCRSYENAKGIAHDAYLVNLHEENARLREQRFNAGDVDMLAYYQDKIKQKESENEALIRHIESLGK